LSYLLHYTYDESLLFMMVRAVYTLMLGTQDGDTATNISTTDH